MPLGSGVPMRTATKPVSSAALKADILRVLSTTSSTDCHDSHEDKQLLACSHVEQPITLVAARNVADDYSIATNAYAVPLTLSTLSVHDGRITKEDKVFCGTSLKQLLYHFNFIGPGDELRPLPWPSFMSCCGGRWPVIVSDLMLAVASGLAVVVTKVTPQKGSSDYLEVALYLRRRAPPMSVSDPFLISTNVEQELLGMYSVSAVLSGLLTVLFMCDEAELWPFLQFAAVELQLGPSCEKFLLFFPLVRDTFGNCHNILVPLIILGKGSISDEG
jgi:hypothetical protein